MLVHGCFFRGTGKGDNQRIAQEVGVPLCDALVAYDAGDFATAVSLVNPLRYKIINIGGSHAQVKQLISVLRISFFIAFRVSMRAQQSKKKILALILNKYHNLQNDNSC